MAKVLRMPFEMDGATFTEAIWDVVSLTATTEGGDNHRLRLRQRRGAGEQETPRRQRLPEDRSPRRRDVQ